MLHSVLKSSRNARLRNTSSLGPLPELGNRLVTPDSTTPVLPGLLVLVTKVGLGGLDKGGQGLVVLGSNLLEGDNGGGLLVDDCSETGLVLDNNVRDTHLLKPINVSKSAHDKESTSTTNLSAESGQEDDQLNGVNVVSNDNQGSLLGLDEGDTVVQTVLGEKGLLGVLGGGLVTLGSLGLSLLEQTGLLLLGRLGLVLVQELEELGSSVLVQGVSELSDRRGNLYSETEIRRNLERGNHINLP